MSANGNGMAQRLAWLGILVPALCVSPMAMAEWELNLREGVTDISRTVFDIHMTLFWICVVIGVGVFGVMLYSIINHRKSKGAVAAQFHESTVIEILWTVIPTLILVVMAVPATLAFIKLEDNSASDMSIQVIGYQWKWQYKYLDEELDFFSNLDAASREQIKADPTGVENYLLEVDNRLVIPAGKKVRFLISANDVIHSWWVPILAGSKMPFPVLSTRHGLALTNPVSIAASVRSSAVLTTDLCPLWWKLNHRLSMKPGWLSKKAPWRRRLPAVTASGRWTS